MIAMDEKSRGADECKLTAARMDHAKSDRASTPSCLLAVAGMRSYPRTHICIPSKHAHTHTHTHTNTHTHTHTHTHVHAHTHTLKAWTHKGIHEMHYDMHTNTKCTTTCTPSHLHAIPDADSQKSASCDGPQ